MPRRNKSYLEAVPKLFIYLGSTFDGPIVSKQIVYLRHKTLQFVTIKSFPSTTKKKHKFF